MLFKQSFCLMADTWRGEPEEGAGMQVPRPKLELDLPYKSYKLVTSDGRGLERLDKHPFCMSRVYYDAREKPAEVWAEDISGSYRWRQTGSEVKVIALKASSSAFAMLRERCSSEWHVNAMIVA